MQTTRAGLALGLGLVEGRGVAGSGRSVAPSLPRSGQPVAEAGPARHPVSAGPRARATGRGWAGHSRDTLTVRPPGRPHSAGHLGRRVPRSRSRGRTLR